jgi:filamentous hemagglutinin
MVAGATAAAVTTLASQASVSLINNQGDLGQTLNDLGSSDNVKGLVTAMLKRRDSRSKCIFK